MAITDATTSLTTAWTEYAPVTFNSGTLGSITDCVTEVESKLQRGTLSTTSTPTSTSVQRWLIRAKEELAEIKGYTWRRRYAYCTTVAGTYRYALPPDYNGGHVSVRDTTNDRPIVIHDKYYFETKFPDVSEEDNDEPLVACIKNMELWVAPPPGGAYTFELEYDRSGADNTTTDFTWLPEMERFRCCDKALGEAFEALHMWEVSDRYNAKWAQGIGKSIRADGKRKWSSMDYRFKSNFQEHAAQHHQQGNS